MSFNRPNAPKDRPAARRDTPRLWADGNQQPRFDLRGFSRVSLLMSRRMARPLLMGTARFFTGSAERMAENTLGPRFARSSKLARALPSRDVVARGLTAAAGFLSVAADMAVPPPQPVEMAALPEPDAIPLVVNRRPRQAELRLGDTAQPRPTQVQQARTVPEPPPVQRNIADADADLDAPTIAAIRAMIDEMRDVRPAKPAAPAASALRPDPVALPPPSGRVLLTRGVPLTPAEPRAPTLGETIAGQGLRLAAGLVAGAATMLTLPVGMVRAILTHLHGNDLRTWS